MLIQKSLNVHLNTLLLYTSRNKNNNNNNIKTSNIESLKQRNEFKIIYKNNLLIINLFFFYFFISYVLSFVFSLENFKSNIALLNLKKI